MAVRIICENCEKPMTPIKGEPGCYECKSCAEYAERDWNRIHASKLPERKNCGRRF